MQYRYSMSTIRDEGRDILKMMDYQQISREEGFARMEALMRKALDIRNLDTTERLFDYAE